MCGLLYIFRRRSLHLMRLRANGILRKVTCRKLGSGSHLPKIIVRQVRRSATVSHSTSQILSDCPASRALWRLEFNWSCRLQPFDRKMFPLPLANVTFSRHRIKQPMHGNAKIAILQISSNDSACLFFVQKNIASGHCPS